MLVAAVEKTEIAAFVGLRGLGKEEREVAAERFEFARFPCGGAGGDLGFGNVHVEATRFDVDESAGTQRAWASPWAQRR